LFFLIQRDGKDGIAIVLIPLKRGVNALFFDKYLTTDCLDTVLIDSIAGGVDGVFYLEYFFVNSTARPM
jgi:hypothetical protein